MSHVTPAAAAQLRAQGYKIVFETFGPPASGKSRRAAKRADELRAAGRAVVIEDEIVRGTEGGVRVWAR